MKIGQCAAAAGLLLGLIIADTAQAQKQGGILRVWQRDSPGNMSILEEGTMRQGTCWRPELKGLNLQVNSIYNGWRMEDVWLDR